MRNFYLLIFVLIPINATAQSATPELITDRPDQTESPSVVPHKYLQVECGFVIENDENNNITLKSVTYDNTLMRYGLLDNFELRFGLGYLGEKLKMNNAGTWNSTSGFGPLYTGFKVKIAGGKGIRPECAFLGGLILPFTAGKDFKTKNSAAEFLLAFSNTISDRFSIGYNLGTEWDGETSVPVYIYSASLGIKIANRLSGFIESYGYLHEKGNQEHLADTGISWLILNNLQLDVSCGIGLNKAAADNFIGSGISLRLPR
jgi:hypothetical protein